MKLGRREVGGVLKYALLGIVSIRGKVEDVGGCLNECEGLFGVSLYAYEDLLMME